MTTAEVTPTSIALAIIGGQKEILADVLEKIPTGKPNVEDVNAGVFPAVTNFVKALKGTDADCLDTKVADILTNALKGVTILADGAAHTAPGLCDVAHCARFHKQRSFKYEVRATISRMFEQVRPGAGYVNIPPNSLGDVQFRDILASAMAEIFFAHIARELRVDSMSLLPLSLVQFISKVTGDPVNPDRILPTTLMVEVLSRAHHIALPAYRDPEECTNESYIVLISRFELFLNNTLRGVSFDTIHKWAMDNRTTFIKDNWLLSCTKAVSDMIKLSQCGTSANAAPPLVATTTHRGDEKKKGALYPLLLHNPQPRKIAQPGNDVDRGDELDNETRATTSLFRGGLPIRNVTQSDGGTGGGKHSREAGTQHARKRVRSAVNEDRTLNTDNEASLESHRTGSPTRPSSNSCITSPTAIRTTENFHCQYGFGENENDDRSSGRYSPNSDDSLEDNARTSTPSPIRSYSPCSEDITPEQRRVSTPTNGNPGKIFSALGLPVGHFDNDHYYCSGCQHHRIQGPWCNLDRFDLFRSMERGVKCSVPSCTEQGCRFCIQSKEVGDEHLHLCNRLVCNNL